MSATETVVELQEWGLKSLELQVERNGKPLSNVILSASLAYCPCWGCWSDLAETDEKGKVLLPEFYPEQWGYFSLKDKETKKIIWDASVKEIYQPGLIKLDIGR